MWFPCHVFYCPLSILEIFYCYPKTKKSSLPPILYSMSMVYKVWNRKERDLLAKKKRKERDLKSSNYWPWSNLEALINWIDTPRPKHSLALSNRDLPTSVKSKEFFFFTNTTLPWICLSFLLPKKADNIIVTSQFKWHSKTLRKSKWLEEDVQML